MIILTDITEKRKLENQIEIERNQLNMVVKAIKNYENFIECINEYKNFFTHELLKILNSDSTLNEIINIVFRKIHTLKGNFQQIEMVNVVDFLHNIEEELYLIQSNNINIDIKEFKLYLQKLNFSEKIEQDLQFIINILGEKFLTELKLIKLDPNELDELEKEILKLPQKDITLRIIEKLRSFKQRNIKEFLIPLIQYTSQLAERKGKLINKIELEGDDVFICYDNYKSFIKSLIHIFRNCIDHGIELPEERIKKGKKEYGTIRCILQNNNDHFLITISDDGTDIDIEKLKGVLIKNNHLSINEIIKFEDNDLINFIFIDGFSTKETVSDISGRGFGLASLKSEVEKLNGNIKIHTKIDQGLEFVIQLPKQNYNKPTDDALFILKNIVDFGNSFFSNIYNLEIYSNNIIEEYFEERLLLKTFSSFIEVKTNSEIKVIISIDYNLTKHLLYYFMPDISLNQNEIHKYLEDTVSETLNTILGNSTQNFSENGYKIDFCSPVIMTSDEAIFKYPPTKKWKYILNTNKGDIIFYTIK